MPSSKRRAQGGGRTANSEPRQQVFSQFNGCNFELSPRDFTLGKEVPQEQSDLMMNYVVVQDNVTIASNKTMETRNNLVKLFEPPENRTFTGADILVEDELYAALDNGNLMYGSLDTGESDVMVNKNFAETTSADDGIVNHTGTDHTWVSFAYVDNKLAGLTEENQMWTGEIGSHRIDNAKRVPDPGGFSMANLAPKGKLRVSSTETEACPFRVAIAYCMINKYGPTMCSPQFTFWANIPVDEWHAGQYLNIHTVANQNHFGGYDVKAVELYYIVGNAQSLQFAARTDLITDHGEGNSIEWSINWFGYLDATSMWPMANLMAPTENVTEGVKASHMTCIDSRMYFWGSDDNPQRLWIGGNPGNLFSISPGTGGGFVDVEPGSGQEVRVVTKYKTQSGNSIVTMLCDSPNSSMEQRFNLVENSVSISNEQSMKSWQAEQVAGSVGCKSFRGGIACEDGLYAVSRYGLSLTTMTMEYNSQIRTNYVSDPIKPVFTDKIGDLLSHAVTIECDGVIYVAFGRDDTRIDNLLFCYDIDAKAWWTISLDLDEPIIDMLHIDWEGSREGIGIVTENAIWLLPLTEDDSPDYDADFAFTIQTGELSTQQPQQSWFYLSQIEFRFDRFIGDMRIELMGIDQFGRKVQVVKNISHDEAQYNLAEYMRVDLRLQSYQLRFTGQARFRLTHWISKLYVMSNKQGIVWGFDDSKSFREFGDIYPTFKSYNDIRKAIIP